MAQASTVAQSEAVQRLREQVALANRLLHHYGLAAYQGHVSARIPDSDLMLIRAYPAVSLERTQPEDLMVMDLDGNIVEASKGYPTPVPSWRVDAEIYYARAEVRSVAHTHQKWCTIFGIAGRDVLPVLHPPTASVAAESWPVYEESRGSITDVKQARAIATMLGSAVACHLRNHGMVFVGPSVARAVITAADAEQQAEITWRAMLMGGPVETIPMFFLRDDVERRFVATREEEVREGVARGEWGNHVWLDQNRDAVGERRVWL